MAKYSGTAGGKSNIIGLKKARAHYSSLKSELVIKDSTSTAAGRGLHAVLRDGVTEMQDIYSMADSLGVENADHVLVGSNVMSDGWGRVFARRSNIGFAEFGAGVNLNSGSSYGSKLGYTPASWSTSVDGKGFLTGNRFVVFQGWWPVKKSVRNSEIRQFTSTNGTVFNKRVSQGNAPVNGTEAAVKAMHLVAAPKMKHFIELEIKKWK